MHDGSVVRFRRVGEDYDPTSRDAAYAYVRERQGKGEVVTGLLYIDESASDMHAVAGTIDVALSDAELAERRRGWTQRGNDHRSGTLWKYAQTVGDAEKGAVTHPGGRAEVRAYADI